ncbi:MAG: cation diffusion facilitator family transporter [Lachnospiraceae bacterium]|nr:cation diffusion facilitator family transporter [Lachnospiraceae bacterium]
MHNNLHSREKAQIVEGIVSVVVNALLFAIKFWAGTVTGSIALIADAWHTMSDSLTSIFVVFSAKLASKKPDKEHPFGHGRWEQLSAIFIALVLGIIAYEFLTSSIERFQNKESVVFGTLAIFVTVFSIIAKEVLAQYSFYLGRKTNNVVLVADGWHHRSDSLSSVVVLIGIIISRFMPGLWWMDSVLGMFCALAIFYAAFQILKESITKILGEEPDKKLIDEITAEIKQLYGNDLKVHHFHLHNYILQKELTLHIMLNKNMSIEGGHIIATSIEAMIKERFGMETTIHIEPLE